MLGNSVPPPVEPLPVYRRARQIIQEMIEGPDHAPGDRIPAERVLSERLGISRMTIRKALEELVRIGLLERHGTSGTRIAAPRVTRPVDERSPRSISQMVASFGGRPGSRLLHFEPGQAGAKMAGRLGLTAGAPLLVIRRLRTANGTPFCVETSYLPAALLPGLAADDLAGDRSLYQLLDQRYGLKLTHGEGLISVSHASLMEAQLLGLEPDAPVLVYRSVVQAEGGQPVEYLTSVNHPRLVAFKTSHGEQAR